MDFKIDLHTHTTCSDGALSPEQLVQRAIDNKLTHLAITDHDTVGAIKIAKDYAKDRINIISGIEISTTWQDNQIHIVGLFIDENNSNLLDYIAKQNELREQRAKAIGDKLKRLGFENAYEDLKGNDTVITRGTYAQYIYEKGGAISVNDAFLKYLKKGKSAYVSTKWGDIKEAVECIIKAGGISVLAHPKRYKFTNTKLKKLIAYFKSVGGQAMEVASCSQKHGEREYLGQLCKMYDLQASVGSDFHYDGSFRFLGYNLDLNKDDKPVWLGRI